MIRFEDNNSTFNLQGLSNGSKLELLRSNQVSNHNNITDIKFSFNL